MILIEFVSHPRYLYHLSPESRKRSILRRGILVSGEWTKKVNSQNSSQHRIYLTDDPESATVRSVAMSKDYDDPLVIYKIDTSLIDNEFEKDPDGTEHDYYTVQSIPASAIVDIQDYGYQSFVGGPELFPDEDDNESKDPKELYKYHLELYKKLIKFGAPRFLISNEREQVMKYYRLMRS